MSGARERADVERLRTESGRLRAEIAALDEESARLAAAGAARRLTADERQRVAALSWTGRRLFLEVRRLRAAFDALRTPAT